MTTLTLCYCVHIELLNGDTIGFTDLDDDVVINGITYSAGASIEPTATAQNRGFEIDNAKIQLLVDNPVLTPAMIESGVANESRIKLLLANYVDLSQSYVLLNGFIGEVDMTEGIIDIEINSVTQRLNKPVTRLTSTICPFQFGGEKCGLDLAALNYEADNVPIASFSQSSTNGGRDTLTFTLDMSGITFAVSTELNQGYIQVNTGANRGLRFDIDSYTQNGSQLVITALGRVSEDLTTSDTVYIARGCAKTRQACESYNNVHRFGGFFVGGLWVRGNAGLALVAEAEQDRETYLENFLRT